MSRIDPPPLEERLSAQLKLAMRARDRAVVSALRSALGRIANAQAVPVPGAASGVAGTDSARVAGAAVGVGATEAPRRALGAAEVSALVTAERAELLSHAQRLRDLCRWDEADGAQRAADVLGRALSGTP